jgi:hypothetical protein
MKSVLAAAIPLLLAIAAGAQEPGEDTPLFREDSVLEVTLSGPIRQIANRAASSVTPYPATMEAAGETLAIELSARGLSRRERRNCRFPPLRIAISGNPGETSLFDHQGQIKLVTHCNPAPGNEQYVLREYLAYRLYNLITPESFRARLLRVTYVDQGQHFATRWGFFIEDGDDAARRLGLRELEVEGIEASRLSPRAAARVALFQYLIGNTDWDVTSGPEGTQCCHNSRLAAGTQDAFGDIIALPYDFDNSGLVSAPYAVPSPTLPINSVRQRLYRGYCSHNALVIEQAEGFRQARHSMEAEIRQTPGLQDSTRRTLLQYVDRFFADIASPAAIERNLLSHCRQAGQG